MAIAKLTIETVFDRALAMKIRSAVKLGAPLSIIDTKDFPPGVEREYASQRAFFAVSFTGDLEQILKTYAKKKAKSHAR